MSSTIGTGIGSGGNSNYYAFLARNPNEGKIPNSSEIISGSEHIYVVDSRERDLKYFPNPAFYTIKFQHVFKNITSIELKGSLIPKTEYNVNSENMFIPFNVQDYITGIKIRKRGYGYVDGIYGSGTPNPGAVSVTPPAVSSGIQAEISVVVSNNEITSIMIENRGSGYLRGYYGNLNSPENGFYMNSGASFINNIPIDKSLRHRFVSAEVDIVVGNELIASLTPGQYDFSHPNDSLPGLCREVTRSLQKAIDDAIDDNIIVPEIGGPQTGEEYFPYSTNNADNGSCFLTTNSPNASPNVNVAIQRGESDGYQQSLFLELLWSSEDFSDSSSMRLLGYGTYLTSNKYKVSFPSTPVDQTNNTTGELVVTWSSKPVIGKNDYNLVNTPKYVILSLGENGGEIDRIESTATSLDKGFATLVFDANAPEVVFREPEDTLPAPGTGTSDWSSLLNKPGMMKAIKGADFDPKIISFGPAPLAELNSLTIKMTKMNGDLYDFHGKDHLLVFSFKCEDINSGNKW